MIQKAIDTAFLEVQNSEAFQKEGHVATYIPELSKADPTQLGVCIQTLDGNYYHAGDWQQEFTIQSISKTISVIMALQLVEEDVLFGKVGVEPSGDAFNSLMKLEGKTPVPSNPMINAGAIVTASFCANHPDAFAHFMELVRKLCGRDTIALNETVYLSEKETGDRNRSLAYFLQSEGILACDTEKALDLYFQMCSVNVNVQDLSHYALILANDGLDLQTGTRLVESRTAKVVKTLMMSCGMYDASGEFAIRVGLPAKSGVAGGIMAVAEGKMGIAAFSPALDRNGNSVGAYLALESLSRQLGLHYFAG